MDAHFDLVLLEGDTKLPVTVDEPDPEHSDDEFFFKYLNQKTVDEAAREEQDRLYEANRKKLEANQKRKLYMRQYCRQRYLQNKEEICRRQKEKRDKQRLENPKKKPAEVVLSSEEQAQLEQRRKDRRNELARGRTKKRALLRELNRKEKSEEEVFQQLERQRIRRNELARERSRKKREAQGIEYKPQPQRRRAGATVLPPQIPDQFIEGILSDDSEDGENVSVVSSLQTYNLRPPRAKRLPHIVDDDSDVDSSPEEQYSSPEEWVP